MLMAGANAVQVGTATFADPRAPWRVVKGLDRWAHSHDVASIQDLIGAAHE
jgi:dihydroorotate dehydrogenase (NAD+) catalytic subunit